MLGLPRRGYCILLLDENLPRLQGATLCPSKFGWWDNSADFLTAWSEFIVGTGRLDQHRSGGADETVVTCHCDSYCHSRRCNADRFSAASAAGDVAKQWRAGSAAGLS